jgi:hypothetical protein
MDRDEIFRAADALVAPGDFDEAFMAYQQLADSDPKDPREHGCTPSRTR